MIGGTLRAGTGSSRRSISSVLSVKTFSVCVKTSGELHRGARLERKKGKGPVLCRVSPPECR